MRSLRIAVKVLSLLFRHYSLTSDWKNFFNAISFLFTLKINNRCFISSSSYSITGPHVFQLLHIFDLCFETKNKLKNNVELQIYNRRVT